MSMLAWTLELALSLSQKFRGAALPVPSTSLWLELFKCGTAWRRRRVQSSPGLAWHVLGGRDPVAGIRCAKTSLISYRCWPQRRDSRKWLSGSGNLATSRRHRTLSSLILPIVCSLPRRQRGQKTGNHDQVTFDIQLPLISFFSTRPPLF